jgi:putative ABC transport system permease protein
MLTNYVKTAFRTLWRQKGVTAINILGLAAGMAVCLLVGLLIWDQLTHDQFHPGADRLYRATTFQEAAPGKPFATSPANLAPVLRDGVTGVEAAARMRRASGSVVVDNQGYENRSLYADTAFFDVFGFELTAGSEAAALGEPYTAVVTQAMAERLYGDAEPIGQTFRLAGEETFQVTGVIDRSAYRSDLDFDVLLSFATVEQTRPDEIAEDWEQATAYYTYLRLAPGTTPGDLAPSLRQIKEQYVPDDDDQNDPARFELQAVADIPLSAPRMNEVATGVLPGMVGYFLAALALLVLLAAGFNYVNLSTARSLTRAREVGVRKTVGAHRQQVIGQFIAEAVVVAMVSFVIALVLLQILIPFYNRLSVIQQLAAQIDVTPGPMLYGLFALFALVVGAVAGCYPAWHLSTFQPARVLKASAQRDTPGFSWMTPRKVLIVLQFAIALVVIVTTTLVYRQAQHMARADTNFRTDGLVQVELQNASYGPFQQQARQLTGVERVGAANHMPLTGSMSMAQVQSDQRAEPMNNALYYALDYEAVETLGFPFLATDNWSEARFESGQTVVLNETAVQELGYETPQAALGQPITLGSDTTGAVRIAGVIEDFQYIFLEQKTRPVVLHYSPSDFQVALAQVPPGQEQAMIERLTATWRDFDATNPPSVRGYQDVYGDRFAAPIADASFVLGLVAGLAVLISCLGLLGIATYTVQTRIREIGIRKALGASVPNILRLLSKDFVGLIGIAVVAGLPVAWWMNRLWLQNIPYRIELGAWTFVLCAAGMLALALLAIGPQTLRAARTSPARTLRQE